MSDGQLIEVPCGIHSSAVLEPIDCGEPKGLKGEYHALFFGSLIINQDEDLPPQTMTITNVGKTDIGILSVKVASGSDHFELAGNTVYPKVLRGGESFELTVAVHFDDIGQIGGTIEINTNEDRLPYVIGLGGRVVGANFTGDVDAVKDWVQTQLDDQYGNFSASLEEEAWARASGDSAEAGHRLTLEASLRDDIDAKVLQEQTARVTAQEAQAQTIESLDARVGDNEATIENIQTSYANKFEAAATERSELEARVKGYTDAQIETERSANATRFSSEAAARETLKTSLQDQISATNTTEALARSTADEALSQRTSALEANYNSGQTPGVDATARASIEDESTARANADLAEAQARELLETNFTDQLSQTNAAVQDEITARSEADTALATRTSSLEAQMNFSEQSMLGIMVTSANAKVDEETTARVDADEAMAARLDTIEADYTTSDDVSGIATNIANAKVSDEAAVRAAADAAEVQARQQLEASLTTEWNDVLEATSTSESNAKTYRDQSGQYASAAQASEVSAKLTAQSLMPSTFEQGGKFFMRGYAQDPTTQLPESQAWSFPNVSGIGPVAQQTQTLTGARFDLSNAGLMKVEPGRYYQATVTGRISAASADATCFLGSYLIGISSDKLTYISSINKHYNTTGTSDWVTIQTDAISGDTILGWGAPFIRAMAGVNMTAGTTRTVQWQQILIEDVTESRKSEISANAAQSSAASANDNAAIATSNATLTSQFLGSAAKLVGNFDFDEGVVGWAGGYLGEGDTLWEARSGSFGWATGAYLAPNLNRKLLSSKRAYSVIPGRTYKLSTQFGAYQPTDTTQKNRFYIGIVCLDNTGADIGHLWTIANGEYFSHGQVDERSSTFGEGGVAFPAGTDVIRLCFWGNYDGNAAANSYVNYLRWDDITSEAASKANADVATSQATIATAQAAAAQQNAKLSANLMGQGYFGNANFANWSGTLPDGMVSWDTGTTTVSKVGAGVYGSPNSLRMSGPTEGNGAASGVRFEKSIGPYNQPFGTGQWIVIEVDARWASGTSLLGAGVYFTINDASGATKMSAQLALYNDPDVAGVVGSGNSQNIRQWRKLVQVSGTASNDNTLMRLFVMNNWSGFSANGVNKAIDWKYVNVRAATDQEIASKQATQDISALSATVTEQAGAIVDLQTGKANASTVTALQATVGDQAAAIQDVEQVAADAKGTANAIVGLKLDVNGKISGTYSENDGETSKFGVLSDVFEVASDSTGARTVYSDECWTIYHDNGVKVVELGIAE